jgi:hypothetical protein
MDMRQLEKKLLNHYAGIGGQAVFFMRHREHPRLEERRLRKLFYISERVFPRQPNKVLGACYTQYLENGIVFNRKGQVKIQPC